MTAAGRVASTAELQQLTSRFAVLIGVRLRFPKSQSDPNFLAPHLGLPSQVCVHSEVCGKGIALEHDGDVYSCDHYVYPEYRLGSIRQRSLSDMVFSPRQVKFGYAKSESLPAYCRKCRFLGDCWGECPKNRLLRTPDGAPGLNYLCPGLKRFFKHAVPAATRMAERIRIARHRPP